MEGVFSFKYLVPGHRSGVSVNCAELLIMEMPARWPGMIAVFLFAC